MTNRFIWVLLLCIHVFPVHSQINESIKQKSNENQQNRNAGKKSGSNDAYYYDEGIDLGACLDGCGCSLHLMGIISDGLSRAHHNILSQSDSNMQVSSIDFSIQLGQADVWNWSVVPRLKLRYGVYSTEFRLYQSFEDHIEGQENYGTFDWQMLMFNVVNRRKAHWRIGTGFMHENFSGELFNEHSTVLEIYPAERLGFGIEGRIAPDYQTGILVRQELNMHMSYDFYQSMRANWRVFLNFTRASYYEEVKFNIYSLGIKLNVPF